MSGLQLTTTSIWCPPKLQRFHESNNKQHISHNRNISKYNQKRCDSKKALWISFAMIGYAMSIDGIKWAYYEGGDIICIWLVNVSLNLYGGKILVSIKGTISF